MLDSKFLFTLVGLVVTVFAICNTNMTPAVNEGFWGVSVPRTVRTVREVHAKGPDGCNNSYALPNNFQARLGNNKFVKYPSYQSMLSPRFSNVDYGANIKYNMPSYKYQGAPCDPLSQADMATENYKENYYNEGGCGGSCGGGCGVPTCGKGGVGGVRLGKPNISADPNYINAMNEVYDSSSYPDGTDLVAVGDMTTIGSDGQLENAVMYDRYIVSNAKSRTYGQGCPLRGDLAVVPCSGSGWFQVSANPSIDLREGAMNVMGGAHNETAMKTAELIYAASGGYDNIASGAPLSQGMTNQFSTALGGGLNDISISAFP